MNTKRTLTALIFLAIITHSAELSGEYCPEPDAKMKEGIKQMEQMGKNKPGFKEVLGAMNDAISATECYQFQTGNKVSFIEKGLGSSISYTGTYTQKDSTVNITLEKGDANKLTAFLKNFLMKTKHEQVIIKTCYELVNNYEAIRYQMPGAKRYPQTQQGFDACRKDISNSQEMNMVKMAIDAQKASETDLKERLNNNSGTLLILGNSIHKMNKNCSSGGMYTKKGAKYTSMPSIDPYYQFCLNGVRYNKCKGKEYNPEEDKCENNVLLSKCGNDWYNPEEQYCSGGTIKNTNTQTENYGAADYEESEDSPETSEVPTESPETSEDSPETSEIPTESPKTSAGTSNATPSEETPKPLESLFNALANSGIKFGLKVAYNASTTLYDGKNTGVSHGAEAGIIANIPISKSIEISLGANGIYRSPFTKETIDQNSFYTKSELIEYVASVPVMLKYNISTFYLQAGAQADVPVKKEQKTTKGAEIIWEENTWRSDYDVGIALGLGFYLTKNIAIDTKAVGSVTEYNKEIGGYKLIQANGGLNYFF